jgi:hypothetical protein
MATGAIVGVGPLSHTGAPPIPHLPKAESAAFTGPEIPSASVIAAIGRRTDTATLRRTPIWPASAEWYSWFASKKSHTTKQIRPTPSMRPADARRLLSVGAPSACERAFPLGLTVRAADLAKVGRAERARAEVPDRLVETPSDLFAFARALRLAWRGSPLRPGSRPAGPGAFREFVN